MVTDIIEVENEIVGYERALHLMSNAKLDAAALRAYGAPTGTQAQVTYEAGVYRLRAVWKIREFVEFMIPISCGWQVNEKPDPQNRYCQSRCPLRNDCTWRRRVLLWALQPDEKISKQIAEACATFALQVGCDPQVAFMQRIPLGVEEGALISGAMLISAEWVPEGFAALWAHGNRR